MLIVEAIELIITIKYSITTIKNKVDAYASLPSWLSKLKETLDVTLRFLEILQGMLSDKNVDEKLRLNIAAAVKHIADRVKIIEEYVKKFKSKFSDPEQKQQYINELITNLNNENISITNLIAVMGDGKTRGLEEQKKIKLVMLSKIRKYIDNGAKQAGTP